MLKNTKNNLEIVISEFIILSYGLYHQQPCRYDCLVPKCKEVRHLTSFVFIKYKGKYMKDHKGNTYNTVADMARAWDKNPKLVRRRLQDGWSIEDALTKNAKPVKKIYHDHLGNEYESLEQLAETYNIHRTTLITRLKTMTLEDALTTPVQDHSRFVTDHCGHHYKNMHEMARAYGKNQRHIVKRLTAGWGLEKALTEPIKTKRKL